MTTLVVETIDVRVALDVRGAKADEALSAIQAAWDRCLVDGEGDPDLRVRILAGEASDADRDTDDRRVASDDVDRIMHDLSQAVTQLALTERSGSMVLLHAAALADPATGRAVVCIAPSGTGKTTVCRTLGADWGYVTDETVAIDADGSIAPYPKPLSVWREPDRALKEQVSPTRLGLGECPERVEVGAVVWLDRSDDGPAQPVIERVPTPLALAEVAPQTSGLKKTPRPLHGLAEVLGRAGGLHRVRYREADSLSQVLRGLVEQPSFSGTLVRATRVADLYVEPDDPTGVVMQDDRVSALSPLATTVLRHLAPGRWEHLEHLERVLVDRHGAPPTETASAVAELVEGLREAGLVEVSEG